MSRKGFSNIFIGIIVAVMLAGAGGAFLVSKRMGAQEKRGIVGEEGNVREEEQPLLSPTVEIKKPGVSVTSPVAKTIPKPAPPRTSIPNQDVPQQKIQRVHTSSLFEIPCASNPNPVFQHSFSPLDNIAGIIPPGAAAGEEIKPHSYVDLAAESIPLYAPADMELVEGAYYSEPPHFKVPTTYLLHFQISCEVILSLDHISDPIQKIRDALPKNPAGDTRSMRIRPTVTFQAGELIGYTKGGGGQDQTPPINRFDLGLYNTTHTNIFVNQDRYLRSRTWKKLNAVCAYDSFSDELKKAYYAKFTNFNKQFVPNAPCRIPNQDVPGTLSGAWFFREDSSAVETHVGIALDIDRKEMTVAGLQNRHFSIDDRNPTFNDPANVTGEHCYFDSLNGNRILYFRLLSPVKVKVFDGVSPGGCPSTFPASGTIYLYR